jgi:hypothetical protein
LEIYLEEQHWHITGMIDIGMFTPAYLLRPENPAAKLIICTKVLAIAILPVGYWQLTTQRRKGVDSAGGTSPTLK